MKIRTTILFLLLFSLAGKVHSQDIHFSQYNASPLTLNPALTGFYEGDYRVAGNFRSQWGSFTNPYRTIASSVEISTLKGKLSDDYLSFGLMFYNDKAGTVELGTNSLNFSMAYRKAMGRGAKHALTFGVQTGFIQQKVNTDELVFDNQYNGVEVDLSSPSGEVVGSGKDIGIDLSVGLIYHMIPNDKLNLYIGGAYFHITEPQISLLETSSYTINPKYVGHIGAKIEVSNLINLLPSAVYYQQLDARQINAGTYLQFVLDDFYEAQTAFSIGAWARVAEPVVDAVILGARMDYQNFALGMSYDMNISRLQEVSNFRGAYEISLIYIGEFTTKGKRSFTIPCPQL